MTAGPTGADPALIDGARLLPVERSFRLVCPKYSATRHQRKMYRQPGGEEEREGTRGTPRRFVLRGLPASPVLRQLAGESAKSSVARHPSVRPHQWNYPTDRLKTRFSEGDLNARSRSTATRAGDR